MKLSSLAFAKIGLIIVFIVTFFLSFINIQRGRDECVPLT